MSSYCFLVVKPKLILLLETSLFSSFYNTISISGPTLSHIKHLKLSLDPHLSSRIQFSDLACIRSSSVSPGATLCLDFYKVLLINKSYSSWVCPHLKEDSVYTLEPGRTGFKSWFCHSLSAWNKELILCKLLFPLLWSWDNHNSYHKRFWGRLNKIKNIKYFIQCLTHNKH